MRRPSPFSVPRFHAGSLAAVLVAAPFFVAQGQSTAETTAGASSGASTRRPEPKVLRLEDFAQWNRITSPALSPDGKWMTFTYSPNEGGQTILHVKALDGGKDYTASVGNAAGGGRAGGAPGGRGGGGGGNAPSFSSDSRWAAYMVTPEGRGGAGRGGAGRGRGRAAGDRAAGSADCRASRAAEPRERREGLDPQCRLMEVLERCALARRQAQSCTGRRRDRRYIGGRGPHRARHDVGRRPQHRQREPIRLRRRGSPPRLHARGAGTTRQRRVPARSGHGRVARAQHRAGGLRPARLERNRQQPRGAPRRQTARHEAEGEYSPGLAGRFDGRVQVDHLRSREGCVVPERNGAERVHRAALEQGRLARARRRQGAGSGGCRGRLEQGERRHLALEGPDAAVGADHPASAAAPRDAPGGRSPREQQAREAGRRQRAQRDAGRELQRRHRAQRLGVPR